MKNEESKDKRKRIRKIETGKQLRGKERHEGKFVDGSALAPPVHQVPCMWWQHLSNQPPPSTVTALHYDRH